MGNGICSSRNGEGRAPFSARRSCGKPPIISQRLIHCEAREVICAVAWALFRGGTCVGGGGMMGMGGEKPLRAICYSMV